MARHHCPVRASDSFLDRLSNRLEATFLTWLPTSLLCRTLALTLGTRWLHTPAQGVFYPGIALKLCALHHSVSKALITCYPCLVSLRPAAVGKRIPLQQVRFYQFTPILFAFLPELSNGQLVLLILYIPLYCGSFLFLLLLLYVPHARSHPNEYNALLQC